jgi:hypothetical protein
LAGSFERLVQPAAPQHVSPAAQSGPPLQEHAELAHVAFPEHALPHIPQLTESVDKSVQASLQQVFPSPHWGPPTLHTQVPL